MMMNVGTKFPAYSLSSLRFLVISCHQLPILKHNNNYKWSTLKCYHSAVRRYSTSKGICRAKSTSFINIKLVRNTVLGEGGGEIDNTTI